MADIEELEQAIKAHAMWKSWLQLAIATGEIDTPVEILQKDDQCSFGSWLQGPTLTATEKASMHYEAVKILHKEFHHVAARVAALALNGEKGEAVRMLYDYGEFAVVSTMLNRALNGWKNDLK